MAYLNNKLYCVDEQLHPELTPPPPTMNYDLYTPRATLYGMKPTERCEMCGDREFTSAGAPHVPPKGLVEATRTQMLALWLEGSLWREYGITEMYCCGYCRCIAREAALKVNVQ